MRNHVFHEGDGVARFRGSCVELRYGERRGGGGRRDFGVVVEFEAEGFNGAEAEGAQLVRGKSFGRVKGGGEAFPAVHDGKVEELFKDAGDDLVALLRGEKEPVRGRHRHHVFEIFGQLVGVGLELVEKLDLGLREVAVVVVDRGFVDAVDLVGELVELLGEDVLRRAHQADGGSEDVGVGSHRSGKLRRILLPALFETAAQRIAERAGFKVLDGDEAVRGDEINRVRMLFCHVGAIPLKLGPPASQRSRPGAKALRSALSLSIARKWVVM